MQMWRKKLIMKQKSMMENNLELLFWQWRIWDKKYWNMKLFKLENLIRGLKKASLNNLSVVYWKNLVLHFLRISSLTSLKVHVSCVGLWVCCLWNVVHFQLFKTLLNSNFNNYMWILLLCESIWWSTWLWWHRGHWFKTRSIIASQSISIFQNTTYGHSRNWCWRWRTSPRRHHRFTIEAQAWYFSGWKLV